METELTPTPTSPSSLFTHTAAPTTSTTTIPPAAVPATSGSKQKSRNAASSTSTTRTSRGSARGERITFELDDVLRKYSPEQFKTCKAYDVGGVNILNKKPVDSRTALDKLKRRRETHNRVERRRRDCINQVCCTTDSFLKEGSMSLPILRTPSTNAVDPSPYNYESSLKS
ncbi:MAG: hypothetical protein J3Q66DRAFT_183216 [Benniella sp.]|nr:MAG: hypothetical protein J3Q66DRAFT_183216 [Benniella sp.]